MRRFSLLASLLVVLFGLSPFIADARSRSRPHWMHRNHGTISKKNHSFQPKDKHPKKPKNHSQPRDH